MSGKDKNMLKRETRGRIDRQTERRTAVGTRMEPAQSHIVLVCFFQTEKTWAGCERENVFSVFYCSQ